MELRKFRMRLKDKVNEEETKRGYVIIDMNLCDLDKFNVKENIIINMHDQETNPDYFKKIKNPGVIASASYNLNY